MRPQDMYPELGRLTNDTAARADELALLRVTCETWDRASLRVDAGSPWSTEETLGAAIDDLAAAEDTLRVAVGRLEAAWSALGRLSAD